MAYKFYHEVVFCLFSLWSKVAGIRRRNFQHWMDAPAADEPPDSLSRDGIGHDLELQDTKEVETSDPLPAAHQVPSLVERPQSSLHEIACVAVLCCSQLMTQAGLAQSIALLHVIGESFTGKYDCKLLNFYRLRDLRHDRGTCE
jgi:hypothetical protein